MIHARVNSICKYKKKAEMRISNYTIDLMMLSAVLTAVEDEEIFLEESCGWWFSIKLTPSPFQLTMILDTCSHSYLIAHCQETQFIENVVRKFPLSRPACHVRVDVCRKFCMSVHWSCVKFPNFWKSSEWIDNSTSGNCQSKSEIPCN